MTSLNRFSNPTIEKRQLDPVKLEKLIDLQSEILGATVTNTNYQDLLKQVCLFAEELVPNAVASIMLLDEHKNQMFVQTAPSVPEDAINDLNGLSVGDGSCGNAVFHNDDMYVCNTLTDTRWEDLQDIAKKYQLHACWSSPIRNSENKAIGSFAISSFAKRTPDNFQRRLLNSCASIAGIIIQRENTLNVQRADHKILMDSQYQYRCLVDNSADEIYLHDDTGNILDANQMACNRLGYTHDELLSMNISDIKTSTSKHASVKTFAESLKLDKTYTIYGTHQSKNGKKYPVETRIRRYTTNDKTLIVALARDITDRKKTEEEMARASKLESVGLLAGGIAHDFNNMLGIIQGYIDLASRSRHSPEKTEKHLAKATRAALQAAELTQQLLTFAKGGDPIKQAANIVEIIHQSTDFSLHGSNIKVNFSRLCTDDIWPANIDSGQISQVIQNLVINARQSMSEGGQLDITYENCVMTEAENSEITQHEKRIKITIKDTGTGIPQNIIGSIFDPYFTTKQQGSGLGLALCYSIITKHNGAITVDSTPGHGTCFTLYLPASNEHAATSSTVTSANANTTNARILIMDDDEMLREVTEAMLQNLGYSVTLSADGDSAFAQYQKAMNTKNPIDLVIMDLTIPNGIGGKEAIKLIQQIDPHVNGLVSSGYCNDPVMANHNDYGFVGAIKKPYSQDELGEAVNAILNNPIKADLGRALE
ncbi:MAG: hybrid sensor histidine kinase/response regulator [Gammaproteobacteria bacterium]|nr:MAG: hybrid sensor histidine kinase/response regulator [Gammaproteobacteria bacterium]